MGQLNGLLYNYVNEAKKLYKSNNYSTITGATNNEFRELQEESRRELAKSSGERVYAKNNEGIRERLSTIFRRELDSRGYNASFNRLLHLESKNNIKFDIYQNIDGDLFHDIFEIARVYLNNGKLLCIFG